MRFLLQSTADIWCFAEHRLGWPELCKLKARLRQQGFKLIGVPGKRKNEGISGGVMIVARAHLALWPMPGASMSEHERPSAGLGDDWVAAELHLKSTTIVLVCSYLTNSIGATGVNVEK